MTADELKRVAQLLAADRAQLLSYKTSVQFGDSELRVLWPDIRQEEKDLCQQALAAYTWPTNFPADPVATPGVLVIAAVTIRGGVFTGPFYGIEGGLEWGEPQADRLTKAQTCNLIWTLRKANPNLGIEQSKTILAAKTVTTSTDLDVAAAATLPAAPVDGVVTDVAFARDPKTGRFRNSTKTDAATKMDFGWRTRINSHGGIDRVREAFYLTAAEAAAAVASIRTTGTEITGYIYDVSARWEVPMCHDYPGRYNFSCFEHGGKLQATSIDSDWITYGSDNSKFTKIIQEQQRQSGDTTYRRYRYVCTYICQARGMAAVLAFLKAPANGEKHVISALPPENHGWGRWRGVRKEWLADLGTEANGGWTAWA